MYNYIKGKIVELELEKNLCIIEVYGIGYEIYVSKNVIEKLNVGQEIKFFIEEIVGGFYSGGLPSLYGFLSKEEKQIFLAFKNNLSNVGPKKALEYLDKVSKNLTEFWLAVQSKNYKTLTSLFGFRQSSAEKIISSLYETKSVKTKVLNEFSGINVSRYEEIFSALINLGYKEYLVRQVTNEILQKNSNVKEISELIKLALNKISEIENRK